MTTLQACLFQRWTHSFEDDSGDITVFRPENYPFPPARGRSGIEFNADGTFVDWDIGSGDAQSRGVTGRWQQEGPARLRVQFEADSRAPELLEIIECADNLLKIRQRAG